MPWKVYCQRRHFKIQNTLQNVGVGDDPLDILYISIANALRLRWCNEHILVQRFLKTRTVIIISNPCFLPNGSVWNVIKQAKIVILPLEKSKQTRFGQSNVNTYFKERNFRGKKISRILAKVAISNSFFDPRKIYIF